MAFLKAEYSVMLGFILVATALMYLSGTSKDSHPLVALSFVIGALFSGLAGFFGMRVATLANVRTAAAARRGIAPALLIAFGGGSVMGMPVVGLGIFGLGGLFVVYLKFFGSQPADLTRVINVLTGFSFGASSVAVFARLGGGIYTKAADVGADLVGKVEAGGRTSGIRGTTGPGSCYWLAAPCLIDWDAWSCIHSRFPRALCRLVLWRGGRSWRCV